MYKIKTKGQNVDIIEMFEMLGGKTTLPFDSEQYYFFLEGEWLFYDGKSIFQRSSQNDGDLIGYEKINIDQLRLLVAEKEIKELNTIITKYDCDTVYGPSPLVRMRKVVQDLTRPKKIFKIPTDEIINPDINKNLTETINRLKELIKPKIEVGKVYKIDLDGNNDNILFTVSQAEDDSWVCYGLLDGVWTSVGYFDLTGYIEATDKEWVEALTKEAQRIGHNHKALRLYDNCKLIDHLGNIILKDGQWAEIIPEKKVLFTTKDGVKMYDDGCGRAIEMCYVIHSCVNLNNIDFYRGNYTGGVDNHIYLYSKQNTIAYIKERDEKLKFTINDIAGSARFVDGEYKHDSITLVIKGNRFDSKEVIERIETALNKNS